MTTETKALPTGQKDKAQTLDYAAIVAASDIATHDVFVPQWNGSVTLRELSAADRSDIETYVLQHQETGKTMDLLQWRVRLVSLSVVNAKGQPMFVTDEAKAALASKSYKALDLLFNEVLKLNGMERGDDEAKAQDFTEDPASVSSTD